MLTATSGKHNNVITFVYDDGGRVKSETVSVAGRAHTTHRDYDRSRRARQTDLP